MIHDLKTAVVTKIRESGQVARSRLVAPEPYAVELTYGSGVIRTRRCTC